MRMLNKLSYEQWESFSYVENKYMDTYKKFPTFVYNASLKLYAEVKQ